MPTVSVIIPSYNHEKFISEAIQSVLDQTYQDFEIIIIDDASTDNTVKKIKAFRDRRIRFVASEKNRGQFVSTNHAIALSKGSYISILNSDDSYMPDKLEKQITFLEKNPRYAAVFSYAKIVDEEGKKFHDTNHFYYHIFKQLNRTRYEWLNHFFYKANALCHPSVLVRRSCHDELGVYNESFAQVADLDMWIRICMKYDIHIIKENLIKFRVRRNEENMSGTNPENTTRFLWEYETILKHYLKIDSLEELLSIFPFLKEKYPKQMDESLIPFYVAQLALETEDSPHSVHQIFAINVLYELLSDKKYAEKLEHEHHFTYSDFIRLSGAYDFFKVKQERGFQEQIENLTKDPEEYQSKYLQLVNENNRLKEQIEQILSLVNTIKEKNKFSDEVSKLRQQIDSIMKKSIEKELNYAQLIEENNMVKQQLQQVLILSDLIKDELVEKKKMVDDERKIVQELKQQLEKAHEEEQHRLEYLMTENEHMKSEITQSKNEIQNLEGDLNKVMSAKFFKLWQSYCKIREALQLLIR